MMTFPRLIFPLLYVFTFKSNFGFSIAERSSIRKTGGIIITPHVSAKPILLSFPQFWTYHHRHNLDHYQPYKLQIILSLHCQHKWFYPFCADKTNRGNWIRKCNYIFFIFTTVFPCRSLYLRFFPLPNFTMVWAIICWNSKDDKK